MSTDHTAALLAIREGDRVRHLRAYADLRQGVVHRPDRLGTVARVYHRPETAAWPVRVMVRWDGCDHQLSGGEVMYPGGWLRPGAADGSAEATCPDSLDAAERTRAALTAALLADLDRRARRSVDLALACGCRLADLAGPALGEASPCNRTPPECEAPPPVAAPEVVTPGIALNPAATPYAIGTRVRIAVHQDGIPMMRDLVGREGHVIDVSNGHLPSDAADSTLPSCWYILDARTDPGQFSWWHGWLVPAPITPPAP